MRFSLEWLKDYVNIEMPVEELASRLTMAGIAVENIEKLPDDAIIELDLTPNRGDCLGLINLAREVSAVTGQELHLPQPVPDELEDDRIENYISIQVDPELCPRYAARVVKNVRIAPSPVWMQERLMKSGIRPINNVVDVTNYVMLETNQPLHAFDYARIEGKLIQARRAYEGEKMATLDGGERILDPDMLVIADAVKPVALAGVMGGANSEITDETTTILLESANFNNISIRRTSRKVGLRTESSLRFEKGMDIEGVIYALNRAARLLEILGAGEVVGGICDVYPYPIPNKTIALRPHRLNQVLGTDLAWKDMAEILSRLRFRVDFDGDNLVVTVPSYRPDIEIEEDLIEEVARLYGYDKIPMSGGAAPTTVGYRDDYRQFRDRLVDTAGQWLRQVVTYSFINPKWLDILKIPTASSLRNFVEIANPFSEEQRMMRTTLLPGLLDVAIRNISRRNEDLAIFEMGNIYLPKNEGLPDEVLMLAGLMTGMLPGNWQVQPREVDFYALKGIMESLLSRFNLPAPEFLPVHDHDSYHPGRTARIVVNGGDIGWFGELHPTVLAQVDINKRVYTFEINVARLYQQTDPKKKIAGFSKYPPVLRDLALVVPEEVKAAELIAAIREAGGELLQNVKLFDVYRSQQLGADKTSLAFTLSFQSMTGTLQDEEVNAVIKTILETVENRFGARLR